MNGVALRGVIAGTLIVAITVLPMTLCGVLIVQLSADLDLSNGGLGLLFAVFFASAALTSASLGRFTERVGPRTALRIGALAVGAASLTIATVVRHWTALVAVIAVIGAGSALTRPAAGLWIARVIPRDRQGLAMGVNHTSVLVAMLAAGIALPTVALRFGWRAAFLVAAVLAVLAVFSLPSRRGELRVGRAVDGDGAPGSPDQNLSRLTLAVLLVSAAFGTAGASSLGAFTVPTLISRGVGEVTAGLLVAVSSLMGLVSRVGVGVVADRRSSTGLFGTAVMILLGAGGFVMLGTPATGWAIAGVLVAYSTAWSWLGLFNLAMLRLNPRSPASAIGRTQVGPFVGGVVGPLALGGLVERFSFQFAWSFAAALALVAATGVLAIHRRVVAPVPTA